MKSEESTRLIVYGHGYCSHSRYMRTILDERKIDYEWRDVMEGPDEFKQQLKDLAKGCLSVPTVVFPDGSFLVEPSPGAVLKKLNLAQPNEQAG